MQACLTMEGHGQGQLVRSRVARVSSEDAWDALVAEANAQGSPVVAHFSASWCVPSMAMNPFFEELAYDHQQMMFTLVDVDEAKGVAKRLDVKAMPTFLVFAEGKAARKLVGANPDEVRKMVDGFVAGGSVV